MSEEVEICPSCGENIEVFDMFKVMSSPEYHENLVERKINVSNGHKLTCSNEEVKL